LSSERKQFSKAYIERNNNGRLDVEMQDIRDELKLRDIPFELFSNKQMQCKRLQINRDVLVVGYVDSIHMALRQMGIPVPDSNDYPHSLRHLLYRSLEEATLRELRDKIYVGDVPIFAKPRKSKKRFTGRVFASIDDFMYLSGISIQTPIYLSDVVTFRTEYRVYVIDSKIVGIKQYAGDVLVPLDKFIVKSAIVALTQAGEATAGYAIDFGVLPSVETALIEWNDGYSLGSYNLDKAIYTDLLIARWNELMRDGYQISDSI